MRFSFETERSTELLSFNLTKGSIFNSIHSSIFYDSYFKEHAIICIRKWFAGQKTIDKSMMMPCGPKRHGWQPTWRMALGHGDAVRFIGPLWGESTADHWIPLTRRWAMRNFDILSIAWTSCWRYGWFDGDLRCLNPHETFTVMIELFPSGK